MTINQRARVLLPNRGQMELRASDLESLLPEGHRARLVWAYVERQDLSRFYAGIRAAEGGVGRAAIAPEILLALWLYATLDGVGSAREVSRLIDSHDGYRWLCGGVQVNHHTLSDFRKNHGEALDELLSLSIASLMAAGVGKLKAELEPDPGQAERARQAARLRAAAERQARLEKALARLPEIEAIKKRQGKRASEARASTTDAEATVMKMGDGGFRPAYNAQLASDADSLVIVGVEVATVGNDQGQMAPMLEQVIERCGQAPEAWLVEGGFVGHAQIEQVADKTVVDGPVPAPKDETVDPHQPKATDSPAVAVWRSRMATDEAKHIYKKRAATAECVNAQARNRGLQQFRVRGLAKVKCVMLLFALAHNLMRTLALAPELLGIGTGASVLPGIGA